MKTSFRKEFSLRVVGLSLVAVIALVVLALGAATMAQAQTPSANAPPATGSAKAAAPAVQTTATPAAAEKEPRGKGMNTGIMVYGKWKIEVRNPDGSVAKHLEFENALFNPYGQSLLAGLLSGVNVAGSWWVWLAGTNEGQLGAGPCVNGADGDCEFTQPGPGASSCAAVPAKVTSGTQPPCYATLALSLGAPVVDGYGNSYETAMTLNGQAYVDTDATLFAVGTSMVTCNGAPQTTTVAPGHQSPNTCQGGGGYYILFTQYTFETSPTNCGQPNYNLCQVPVYAGQIVAATVTFSFGSPTNLSTTSAIARPHALERRPHQPKPPLDAKPIAQ